MKNCHLVSTIGGHHGLTYETFNEQNINDQNWQIGFQGNVDSYSVQVLIVNFQLTCT